MKLRRQIEAIDRGRVEAQDLAAFVLAEVSIVLSITSAEWG